MSERLPLTDRGRDLLRELLGYIREDDVGIRWGVICQALLWEGLTKPAQFKHTGTSCPQCPIGVEYEENCWGCAESRLSKEDAIKTIEEVLGEKTEVIWL